MKILRFRISVISIVLFLAATNLFAEVWNWQYIPHIAAGGGWTSYLTISDPHGVSSKQVWIDFYDDSGQALTLNVDGVSESGAYYTLDAYQERTFVITSGSSTSAGQLRIASQGIERLNVSLRYAYSNGSSISDAVGILPAIPNSNWSFSIDKQTTNDSMGVAVANPFTSASTISFDLYQNGMRVPGTSSVSKSIAAKGHLAIFVSQLFPSAVYSGTVTLEISATQKYCAVALRADGTQYSSLSVNPGVQSWSVAVTGETGVETWAWRFIDGISFFGSGTNPYNVDVGFPIRGAYAESLTPKYFMLEWYYVNSDGSQGVMLWQGTISNEAGVDVINGTRQQIKLDGTIVKTATFKATRTS
jgi:hypothetical protein